jgi:hypothetical protein
MPQVSPASRFPDDGQRMIDQLRRIADIGRVEQILQLLVSTLRMRSSATRRHERNAHAARDIRT